MKKSDFYWHVLGSLAMLIDLPVLRLINAPVRFSLHRLFAPTVKKYLAYKYKLDNHFDLICRHSVLEAQSYNFLFSDLDLTIVLSAKDLEKAEALRLEVDRLRRPFIFMGELEIYERDEFAELERAVAQKQNLYGFLRDIRKIGWIQQEESTKTSRYHSVKRKRAITKILRRLGAKTTGSINTPLSLVEPVLEARIQKSFPTAVAREIDFKIDCPYMGLLISGGMPHANQTAALSLNSKAALCLLAIAPFEPNEGEIKNEISRLRLNPEVRREWQNELNIEALTLGGVYRARPNLFPWMPAWKKQLEAWREN